MKTCILASAVLVLSAVLTGTAGADAIPFTYRGPGVSVSGTLFGSSNADGSWTITDIQATYNRIPVAGILPLGTDPRLRFDNLYYEPGRDGLAVDLYGIAFRVPGFGDVKICAGGGPRPCGLRGDYEFEDNHHGTGYLSVLWNGDDYQFTQVRHAEFGPAVPEPATFFILGGGMAAVAALARRHLR